MASTYSQVSYGSSGEAVRQLQQALNAQGYSLDVDGVFGSKTRTAVKNYQKKNGLQVDGIAGNETWGSLTAAQAQAQAQSVPVAAVSESTARALAELEKGVTPSVETETAFLELKSLQESQPVAYSSDFQSQLNDLYDRIVSREDFTYEPQSDEVYQSYARQYARAGQQAMTDTLGKAASLTGGYGSTYAQSSAQQAYNSYLAQLSNMIPELQQNAYSIYKSKGDALLKQYELLKSEEDSAYDRWRDSVTDWQKQVTQASDAYDTATAADLKNYQLLLSYYADKAEAERKRTAAGIDLSPEVAVEKSTALSSVANESLKRTVTNYLKKGQVQKAKDLLRQYESRMSAVQRQQYSDLFAGYAG